MGILNRIADAFRTAPQAAPVGRNEPCWCGSGRKYKRCHLDSDRGKSQARQKACVSS